MRMNKTSNILLHNIKQLIESARQFAVKNIDRSMTLSYFLIGKLIIDEEQQGAHRAKYADETLKFLSKELSSDFGKGFSERNLQQMRKFYFAFQNRINFENISQTISAKSDSNIDTKAIEAIPQTISAKFNLQYSYSNSPFSLSWSHYVFLCRIENIDERNFYEIESANNNWTLKELERQFNSSLFERLALSRNKEKVKELSDKGHVIENPHDLIRNPYVLEFLGLKEETAYSETELESAIISKIEHFMLEMGKGFLFSGRQARFTFDDEHYFVDLVFYNRLLKCFVLIDLKIGKLKHQDLGQMQMYVNYYDRFVKTSEENKTIGIIICKQKHDAIVEITLPKDNEQIFASQYLLYLPSKEELKNKIME
jgi:predicted nuclease of restriction endonuclease-like (RecB) superfamily